MVGAYTPFEVEAERRREVLEDSMRDVRGGKPARKDAALGAGEVETKGGHGLGRFAAGLLNRVAQRA